MFLIRFTLLGQVCVGVCMVNLFTFLAPYFTMDRGEGMAHFLFFITLAGIKKWRVSVSRILKWVYVLCCVLYKWWMWDEEGWSRNLVPTVAYSFWKAPRGLLGLMPLSDGQITINTTNSFTTTVLQRDMVFKAGIFGAKIEVLPWFQSQEEIKNSNPAKDLTQDLCIWDSDFGSAP